MPLRGRGRRPGRSAVRQQAVTAAVLDQAVADGNKRMASSTVDRDALRKRLTEVETRIAALETLVAGLQAGVELLKPNNPGGKP